MGLFASDGIQMQDENQIQVPPKIVPSSSSIDLDKSINVSQVL